VTPSTICIYSSFVHTSQDNDDCSIGSLSLGHISSIQTPVAAIQAINGALEPAKRGLDFVTLSLPAKPDWSTTSLGAALSDVKQATNSAPCGTVALTGLDFSTATLSTLSDADVGSVWQEVMLPLSQRGLLSTVTIATNAFTYPAASLLYELLNDHNRQAGGKQRIEVVATELLRSHKSRPGLLSGGYPYAIPHRMSAPSTSQSANGGVVIDVGHAPAEVAHLTGRSPVGTQGVQRVQEAAEDFRMAMDRCMHAEKTFLAKVPECDHCRVC
jgi:hypothetical protein